MFGLGPLGSELELFPPHSWETPHSLAVRLALDRLSLGCSQGHQEWGRLGLEP